MIGSALRFSAWLVDGGVAVVSVVGGKTADGLRWLADRGQEDSSTPAANEKPAEPTAPTED